MMIKKYPAGAALALGLAFVVPALVVPACATDSGFYVGANVGQSKFDIDKSEYEEFYGTTAGLDDTDTAWSLVVGYRFVPYFGLEGGYLDLGGPSFAASGQLNYGGGVIDIYTDHLESSIKGETLQAVGAIPIGNFEITGRYGLFWSKIESTATSTGSFTVPGFPSQRYDISESTCGIL